MKSISRLGIGMALGLGFTAMAQATPVTINMTADNAITSGGLCGTPSCQHGPIGWRGTGLPYLSDWKSSSTLTIDLDPGTHYFAWRIENLGTPSNINPAGLLAEILWDSNINASSSAWEIYDYDTGAFISYATEYGNNGGNNVWTAANGGAIAGIGSAAQWIYSDKNFTADAETVLWIRTSITITTVPEPAALTLLGIGLLGLFGTRKRPIGEVRED